MASTSIDANYKPTDEEPFMNERQREYFRKKLNDWKEEILKESRETIQNLQAETVPHADLADRASTEAERQLELHAGGRPADVCDLHDRAEAGARAERAALRGGQRAAALDAELVRARGQAGLGRM